MTILTAHVLVKLAFTAFTLLVMVAAGKRYYPADLQIPIASFTAALLMCVCPWVAVCVRVIVRSVWRRCGLSARR